MAFLCPVRIRRGKKKSASVSEVDKELSPGMGRITGSASIETLVRVGIEKEHGLSPDSKMVVLHDFTPCVDDELEVKRGQIVNMLYRENDWVYVIAVDSRQEGFIPYSYCAPYSSSLAELAVKKKIPRDMQVITSGDSSDTNLDGELTGVDTSDCESVIGSKRKNDTNSPISFRSEPDMLPFTKDPSGRYIVLYTFIARDENDVSVERGEFVTVLNKEDPDWFWIVRSDGQEGFIPSGFVYPVENVGQQCVNTPDTANEKSPVGVQCTNKSTCMEQPSAVAHFTPSTNSNNISQPLAQQHQQQPQVVSQDDVRYNGTEMVMLYDYKAQAPDDLNVRRGDWVYADMTNQTVDGWLWAYAPKTRKYGFIPKAYARPPAMTSL